MKILRISPRDTTPIRHKILRPGRPIEECYYPGDQEDQTFHLGAFVDSQLVSIASFYFEKHPHVPDPYQYRLRGMATLDEFRHKGFSSELLKMGFPIVKQNLCSVIWCNARISAQGFYEKIGFVLKSEAPFDIPGIGPHVLMVKYL